MARGHLIQFRVDNGVLEKIDKAAKILNTNNRSEAARFLLYLGIAFLDADLGIVAGKVIHEAVRKFFEEKMKSK